MTDDTGSSEDVARASDPPPVGRQAVGVGVEAWLAAQGLDPEELRRDARASGGAPAPEASRPARRARRRGGAPAAPPEDVETLGPEADHEAVARKILLDQLTGAARSRSELAGKLAKRGVPDDVGERLLDRFEEVGLVDDDAFARAWVQSRQAGKGLARRALAQELRRKGVDDEVAREALDDLDPEEEVEAARRLVRRKLRTAARLDRATAVRRLSGMLARKGYPPGVAFRVVREELDAVGHDPSDDADAEVDLLDADPEV